MPDLLLTRTRTPARTYTPFQLSYIVNVAVFNVRIFEKKLNGID